MSAPNSGDHGWLAHDDLRDGVIQNIAQWLPFVSSNYEDVFNVQAYGAAGNGIADDTGAGNAALQAAAANGGGVVYFPTGIYSTSATLLIPADNIRIVGDGWGSIIKPRAGANFDVFSTPIPSSVGAPGFIRNYISIEWLQINGTNMSGSTAGKGNCIHTYGTRYSYFGNLYLNSYPNWGILLDGDNSGNFGYDNIVHRCVFDVGAAGVFSTNCEANQFHQNQFKYSMAATASAQPALGAQDTSTNHLRFGAGYMYAAGNVLGKGGSCNNPAILCSNSGPCRIIANRFDQVRKQAVTLNAGNHTFAFNALTSVVSQPGATPGIQIGSSNNKVIGNGFDATAGAVGYDYCIKESGGPFSNNVYDDNVLLAGSSGYIFQNATSQNRLGHNPPFTPQGASGPQYGVPASTAAQINYSGQDAVVNVQGGTVTVIAVGGDTLTGITSGMINVPAGQSITLTYSVAPTTFRWYYGS